jgi:hypothetical protein
MAKMGYANVTNLAYGISSFRGDVEQGWLLNLEMV